MQDGAHAEIERLAALHQAKKPLYSDRFLSKQTAGTESLGAPPDAQLSHDDILGAVRELAEEHNVSSARVRGMCMLASAQAGLGNSPGEQAAVLGEVMLTLQRGQGEVSGEQILALSGRNDDTTGLPDAAHPQAAAVLCRSGTGDWAGAGELIARRARELGVPDPLASSGPVAATPGTMQLAISMAGEYDGGDEVAPAAGTTQETRGLQLAAAGQDTAEAAIARHPELSHLFRGGRTSNRRHPSKPGRAGMLTTRTRAHSSDTGDEDPTAESPDDAIARYTAMRAKEFGGEALDAGSHNTHSYGPSPYRSPGPSGKPQSGR